MTAEPMTLLELNNRLARSITATPGLQNVWVTAETSDLRIAGPHCYMELIDKDPATGSARARMRATIWGSTFARLNANFQAQTGAPLASNLKIMVQLSVTYHPVYGLAANITDVDPSYTLGDLLRRRREMIAKLDAAGILNRNRQLAWTQVPWRIAVISAQGAAGYGDFINQLYTNRFCLRFRSRLFHAVMQGDATPASIMAALDAIAADADSFDCVVIIRGGGATGDLASFDHYDLAARIATFPLPVIVGIGHERDITLLDYVANMRVKTPTAAAEWLIGRGADALGRLATLGHDILDAASLRINSHARRLEAIAGQIPELARNVISRNAMRVGKAVDDQLAHDTLTLIKRRADKLEAARALIEALSPQATLRRGFSITRVDGRAVTSADDVPVGADVTTILADGQFVSTRK